MRLSSVIYRITKNLLTRVCRLEIIFLLSQKCVSPSFSLKFPFSHSFPARQLKMLVKTQHQITTLIILALIGLYFSKKSIQYYLYQDYLDIKKIRLSRQVKNFLADNSEQAPRVGEIKFFNLKRDKKADDCQTETKSDSLNPGSNSAENSGTALETKSSKKNTPDPDRLSYFMKIIDKAELDPSSIYPKDLNWSGYNKEDKIKLPQKIVDKLDLKDFNTLSGYNIPDKVNKLLEKKFGTSDIEQILENL